MKTGSLTPFLPHPRKSRPGEFLKRGSKHEICFWEQKLESQSHNNCSTTAAQGHLSSSSSFILLPKYCHIHASITGKATISSPASVWNLHRPGQPLLSFGNLLNGQNIYCMSFSMHQMLMLQVFGCWKEEKRKDKFSVPQQEQKQVLQSSKGIWRPLDQSDHP